MPHHTPQLHYRNNQRLNKYCETLDFATFPVANTLAELQFLLLAATPRGLSMVCFIDCSDQAAKKITELAPLADKRHNPKALVAFDAAIQQSWRGDQQALTKITLDVFGTPFQQQVWQALMSIPCGVQRTYGELAAQLGKPKGARAVGAACGANAISVLIPCHRVVGQQGQLTGYRWGIARKKQLLEYEQSFAQA